MILPYLSEELDQHRAVDSNDERSVVLRGHASVEKLTGNRVFIIKRIVQWRLAILIIIPYQFENLPRNEVHIEDDLNEARTELSLHVNEERQNGAVVSRLDIQDVGLKSDQIVEGAEEPTAASIEERAAEALLFVIMIVLRVLLLDLGFEPLVDQDLVSDDFEVLIFFFFGLFLLFLFPQHLG